MPPAVSVLLPCRDAAPWLPECIESLTAQTLEDFEVLAVDDGSSDGTRGILEAWARRDPRVRVLETGEAGSGTAPTATGGSAPAVTGGSAPAADAGSAPAATAASRTPPARGIVPALRLATAAARAPVLARMDADDVAHPERLEAQRDLLEARPGLAACGTRVRYFPREALGSGYRRYERWLDSLRSPDDIERDLLVECPIAHPTLMIRASALERIGGYRDRGWPEDYDLLLRLHRAGMRAAVLPRVLLEWRLTEGRLSARDPTYAPDAFRRCKVHSLRRGLLPVGRPPVVWGAGSVGKALAREMLRQGLEPAAFVELDPRKIGQRIHGAPVLDPEGLEAALAARPVDGEVAVPPSSAGLAEPPGVPYVLIAVGSPGARDEIREALDGMGLRELADYRALA